MEAWALPLEIKFAKLSPFKVQWCQTVTFKSIRCHPAIGLTYILISDTGARVPECQKLKM